MDTTSELGAMDPKQDKVRTAKRPQSPGRPLWGSPSIRQGAALSPSTQRKGFSHGSPGSMRRMTDDIKVKPATLPNTSVVIGRETRSYSDPLAMAARNDTKLEKPGESSLTLRNAGRTLLTHGVAAESAHATDIVSRDSMHVQPCDLKRDLLLQKRSMARLNDDFSDKLQILYRMIQNNNFPRPNTGDECGDCSTHKVQIDELRSETQEQSSSLRELKMKLSMYEEESERRRLDLIQIKQEHTFSQDIQKALKTRLAEACVATKEHEDNITNLQVQQTLSQKKVQQTETKYETCLQKIQTLTTENTDVKTENRDLRRQLQELETRLENKQMAIASVREENIKLQGQCNEAKKLKNEYKRKMYDLQEDANKYQKRVEELEKENTSLSHELKRVRAMVGTYRQYRRRGRVVGVSCILLLIAVLVNMWLSYGTNGTRGELAE